MLKTLKNRIICNFQDSARLKLQIADSLAGEIELAIIKMVESIREGGKIMVCGNGGSAGDSQHFAAELVNRFESERPGLPAIALTTDTSTITAIANDYAYEAIFAKQVNALGHQKDILTVISTSGNSKNVINAIHAAHAKNIQVIALTGKGGGAVRSVLLPQDIHLCVQGDRTARIQEVHLLIIHCLCDGIDSVMLNL